MNKRNTLGLFQGYGVELEYMIVQEDTLNISPVADTLMTAVAGELTDEYAARGMAWNNELVLHVIEFKTDGPQPALTGLAEKFHDEITVANRLLADHGCRLLPGAMHPWMDPARETRLWPHASNEVYAAFDRIFGCKGHGWSNLQSAHLNLPFSNDDEFRRLHSAIRILLPLIPMLAAASPVMDAQLTGRMDNRLFAYRENCARLPAVTGAVVPDVYRDQAAYHTMLKALYQDLAPHDAAGTLQHEWVNARGVIVRFDRMAMEIRVTDVQEAPVMDLAIAELLVATLKALSSERWSTIAQLETISTADLARLLLAGATDGDAAGSGDPDYLRLFGHTGRSASGAQLWRYLAEAADAAGLLSRQSATMLEIYMAHGTLAQRLSRVLGPDAESTRLRHVYRELAECLASNTPYVG